MPHNNCCGRLGNGRVHCRRPGELLHPARESQKVLDEMKLSIGSEAFEAQYQRRPVPPAGNMFKRDWLSYYSQLPEITEEDTIFQSWDTASKTGPANDWSVGTTWMYSKGHYYLMDVVREKLTYTELRSKMIATAEHYQPWIIQIEDTGVGTGMIADLKANGLDAVEVAATQNKETRAHIQTPAFVSSRVHFPKNASWLSELETE